MMILMFYFLKLENQYNLVATNKTKPGNRNFITVFGFFVQLYLIEINHIFRVKKL